MSAVEPEITISAARSGAEALLGHRVDEIEDISSFAMNQVFRVATGPDVAFLKFATTADLRREAAVLEVVGRARVPAPEVIAADWTGEPAGRPCLVLRRLEGEPMSGEEREFAAAGRILHRLHELRSERFGSVIPVGAGLGGEDPSWHAAVRRQCAGLHPVVEAGLVPRALVDRAIAAVEARAELLATVTDGRLLHGDFHPRHVYAAGRVITGIIDWGDALIGDPLYDLARLLHAGLIAHGPEASRTYLDAVLRTYGPAPARLDRHPELLYLYAAVFTLSCMVGEFAGGAPWPPWWPLQCTALEHLTRQLEA